MSNRLYSVTVLESIRGCRNVYDLGLDRTAFLTTKGSLTTYGDGLKNKQLVFIISSVEGQKGIAESDLIEGILGLQPHYGAGLIWEFLTFWAKLAPALPRPVFVADLKFNGIGEYTFRTIPSRPEDLPSNIVQAYYSIVLGYIYQDGLYLISQRRMLPDLYLYIRERNYEVKILSAFSKPQGLIDDKYYPGRLEESSEPHSALLGHPFFFAANMILKGNDSLLVGLVETFRESNSCIQDGSFCCLQ
ncbi:hypothetical protein COCMIDRAFT_41272 [Bipolaris oryzae ATCC 44560]|uniref:Uncharacterized protein n=1 Tax=Bipolaris oryzae ATCC 44560 TaxID=930090 RepID=W6YS86_COCMI|nr:uncharacterized protein COCMIDRAFT_41272 [Bipolaris oryzae ATCC 44560]EUC40373.1 hypothetical protein COCMIDRAFT_41272 [Bipolaris oryzae ATCC 44560]